MPHVHAPPLSLLSGVKVLIVEDEKLVALYMEDLLRDHGAAEVLWTASLRGAREFLAANSDIAAAVLDLKLEDGNGADLIGEIAGRGIPMVIATGYPHYENERIPVMYKPFASEHFVAAIADAIVQIRS